MKNHAWKDAIRKNKTTMSNWFKYAAYEDNMKELERARSIYERGIDVDHRCIQIWLRYAEMEMRNKQVNHARNQSIKFTSNIIIFNISFRYQLVQLDYYHFFHSAFMSFCSF